MIAFPIASEGKLQRLYRKFITLQKFLSGAIDTFFSNCVYISCNILDFEGSSIPLLKFLASNNKQGDLSFAQLTSQP